MIREKPGQLMRFRSQRVKRQDHAHNCSYTTMPDLPDRAWENRQQQPSRHYLIFGKTKMAGGCNLDAGGSRIGHFGIEILGRGGATGNEVGNA